MERGLGSSSFGIHILDGNLIVPVGAELNDESVVRLQQEIVEKTQATRVRGVLVDVSAVRLLDTFSFMVLVDTARMVSLLGGRMVFVGFQAGVASALMDLDVDFSRIVTALTMEDGLEVLHALAPGWRRREAIDENEVGVEEDKEEEGDMMDIEEEVDEGEDETAP